MKKLISEKTIKQSFSAGKMKMNIPADAIVTPQAEATAAHLGVTLDRQGISQKISYTDRQKIINAVLERFPGGQFSKAKIEKAVRDVLNSL